MNWATWAGVLFGGCAALALVGAAGAVFARETPHAVGAAAAALLGVAGMCLALGSDFVAVAVALVLGVAVPAALLVAAHVAPPPTPDLRPGRARIVGAAVLVVAGFAALGWAVTQTAWPPAVGQRDLTAPWLGWRLLTDDLLALVLLMALLGVAGIAAASLLRGRQPRSRPSQDGPL
jgi:NADH:ubiquinone oxidoreductase subunit 6 (subunit J)